MVGGSKTQQGQSVQRFAKKLTDKIKNYFTPWQVMILGLLICVFFLRLWILSIAPFLVTEDSDAYISAADFLNGHTIVDGARYLGYRQIGYPGLLLFFQNNFELPWYSLAVFQISLSILTLFLLYRVCRNVGLSKWSGLIVLGFFGFNIRDTLYSMVIAPEGLVLALAVFSFFLFSVDVRELYLGRKLGRGFILRIFLQAFVLSYLGIIKQLFLPLAVIIYSSTALMAYWHRRQYLNWRVACTAFLASGALFTAMTVGGMLYAGNLLGASGLNPYCFPWATALTFRYMDFNSPYESDFKQKVIGNVRIGHEELYQARFNYFEGDRKVNYGYWIGDAFYGAQQKAANEKYKPLNSYQELCAVDKYAADLWREALPIYFFSYIRYWFFPEVIRGLFSTDRQEIGGRFRATTIRSFTTYPDRYLEFKDPAYEHLRHGDYEYMYPELGQKFFSSHLIFSLALIAFAIPAWRRRRKIPTAVKVFAFSLFTYCAFLFAAVGGVAWFYERYLTYVSFGIVLLALIEVEAYFKFPMRRKH